MPHNEGKVGVHAFSTDGRKWAMGQPATAYTTHVTWSDGSQVISVCLVASPACAHSPLHPHPGAAAGAGRLAGCCAEHAGAKRAAGADLQRQRRRLPPACGSGERSTQSKPGWRLACRNADRFQEYAYVHIDFTSAMKWLVACARVVVVTIKCLMSGATIGRDCHPTHCAKGLQAGVRASCHALIQPRQVRRSAPCRAG